MRSGSCARDRPGRRVRTVPQAPAVREERMAPPVRRGPPGVWVREECPVHLLSTDLDRYSARVDTEKTRCRMEKDMVARVDDAIRRVQADVLRYPLDLEYDRRSRNVAHTADRLILEYRPGLTSRTTTDNAAIR